MIILLTFVSSYYWKNYRKVKTRDAMLVASGFSMLALAHIIFSAVQIALVLYVVAETVMLAGFIMLLGALVSVIRK